MPLLFVGSFFKSGLFSASITRFRDCSTLPGFFLFLATKKAVKHPTPSILYEVATARAIETSGSGLASSTVKKSPNGKKRTGAVCAGPLVFSRPCSP